MFFVHAVQLFLKYIFVSYCWILFGVSFAERSSGILSGDLLDEGQRDLLLGYLH